MKLKLRLNLSLAITGKCLFMKPYLLLDQLAILLVFVTTSLANQSIRKGIFYAVEYTYQNAHISQKAIIKIYCILYWFNYSICMCFGASFGWCQLNLKRWGAHWALGVTCKTPSVFKDIIQIEIDPPPSHPIFEKFIFDPELIMLTSLHPLKCLTKIIKFQALKLTFSFIHITF